MNGLIYTTTAILTFVCAVTWVTNWLETGHAQVEAAKRICLDERGAA